MNHDFRIFRLRRCVGLPLIFVALLFCLHAHGRVGAADSAALRQPSEHLVGFAQAGDDHGAAQAAVVAFVADLRALELIATPDAAQRALIAEYHQPQVLAQMRDHAVTLRRQRTASSSDLAPLDDAVTALTAWSQLHPDTASAPAAHGAATESGGGSRRRGSVGVGGSVSTDGDAAKIILIAIAAGFAVIIPIAMLEDDYRPTHFPAYPYAHGCIGDTLFNADLPAYENAGGSPSTWSGRIDSEITATDDAGVRAALRLRVMASPRVGIQISGAGWDPGDNADAPEVPTRSLDALVLWRFAQSRRCAFHLGIGGALRRRAGLDSTGISVLYGFEAFPGKGWIIDGTWRWCAVGRADNRNALLDTDQGGFAQLSNFDGPIDAAIDLGVGHLLWRGAEAHVGGSALLTDHRWTIAPTAGLRWWF